MTQGHEGRADGGAQQHNYAHNPIVEAVLELQVQFEAPPSLDALRRVHDAELDRYPSIQDRMLLDNKIEVNDGEVSTQVDKSHIGFVGASEDGLQTFHATTTNFIFGRLAPYSDWTAFLTEANRLWKQYSDAAHPLAVTRIGVRFINQISIPSTQIEIKDYLRTFPEISGALPQTLTGYFMQVTVPLPEFNASTNVTSTISKYSEEAVSILLDIDCYSEGFLALPESGIDLSELDITEHLHRAKNQVFEASITDATRRLID